jgi:hypothetical protein
MRRPGNLGFAPNSPLFKRRGLKRADEFQSREDLEEQYGFMDDYLERITRQQMQAKGRPLTRAEQRGFRPRMFGETNSRMRRILIAVGLAGTLLVICNGL